MLPQTGNFQRLTTWRQVYTQVGVSEWARLRGAWQMKAGECVCVCVWYQCQGVCFCAWPAVSLNNPTCLGPTVIHSLSGNLQYGGEIKWDPGRAGGGGDEALRASWPGPLWVPDSSRQPTTDLLTACVQRRRVREEQRWGLSSGQWHVAGPSSLLCGTRLRTSVGQNDDLNEDLTDPLYPNQYSYVPRLFIYRWLHSYKWAETPLSRYKIKQVYYQHAPSHLWTGHAPKAAAEPRLQKCPLYASRSFTVQTDF